MEQSRLKEKLTTSIETFQTGTIAKIYIKRDDAIEDIRHEIRVTT